MEPLSVAVAPDGEIPSDAIDVKAKLAAEATSPDRFINRELSWLAFNRRVMEEALNHAPSAARAAALPVDFRLQPRRILHGASRRLEGHGRSRGSLGQR